MLRIPKLVERNVAALDSQLRQPARQDLNELGHVLGGDERLTDATEDVRLLTVEHPLIRLRSARGIADQDARFLP